MQIELDRQIQGSHLSQLELALLCISLRWDLPHPRYFVNDFAPALLTLIEHGYVTGIGDDALRKTEKGEQHIKDVFGAIFAEKLMHLHARANGWWIDHLFASHSPHMRSPAILQFVANDLNNAAEVIDQAMCELGEAYRGNRPHLTLKQLRNLGYYVTKKTDHQVAWRYLWLETETFDQGRMRKWAGRRGQ